MSNSTVSCIYCSPRTCTKFRYKKLLLFRNSSKYITCSLCHSQICFSCAVLFQQFIKYTGYIPQHIKRNASMVLLINQIVNSFYEGLSCIPQCPHCAYTRFQDPTLSSVVVISTHSSNFSQYPCLMKHENCSVTKHLQGIAHLHGRFNSLNLYSYFQCPQ